MRYQGTLCPAKKPVAFREGGGAAFLRNLMWLKKMSNGKGLVWYSHGHSFLRLWFALWTLPSFEQRVEWELAFLSSSLQERAEGQNVHSRHTCLSGTTSLILRTIASPCIRLWFGKLLLSEHCFLNQSSARKKLADVVGEDPLPLQGLASFARSRSDLRALLHRLFLPLSIS